MKKKLSDQLSEKVIINSLLKKLNFNKKGTFNFENDAAYLSPPKHYKTIVTTDSITENIDFFKNDPPESVAQKLACVNLSDLSSMLSLIFFSVKTSTFSSSSTSSDTDGTKR